MAKIKRVRWTPLAINDLDHAYDYIARERPSAAKGIVQQVERALDALLYYPDMGRIGRIAGTREFYIANTPFLLAYRIQRNGLEVLAFMHTARRWPESLD